MERIVPFPLYHGSSTHYLRGFRRGGPPADWPLKEHAIGLLRKIWARLDAYGVDPEFWIQNILDQREGPANWQHGVLYVTPSERTAVNYAGGGATHGGELMTLCREGLDRLLRVDKLSVRGVLEHVGPTIQRLLDGGGEPILIEFVDVSVGCLEPETHRDRDQEIEHLLGLSERDRELSGQQTNFRLMPGSGTVSTVHLLDIAHAAYPLSAYSKEAVPDW